MSGGVREHYGTFISHYLFTFVLFSALAQFFLSGTVIFFSFFIILLGVSNYFLEVVRPRCGNDESSGNGDTPGIWSTCLSLSCPFFQVRGTSYSYVWSSCPVHHALNQCTNGCVCRTCKYIVYICLYVYIGR